MTSYAKTIQRTRVQKERANEGKCSMCYRCDRYGHKNAKSKGRK
jgi:hypothetical protein